MRFVRQLGKSSSWRWAPQHVSIWSQVSTKYSLCINAYTRQAMSHYTYAPPFLARLHVDHSAGYILVGKCTNAVMFLQPIVRQCVECLNNTINLHDEARDNITDAMFYRFLAVLFNCHDSGLSTKKEISTLLQLGKTTPSL